MTKHLPIILSIPHAGLEIPEIVKERTALSAQQIITDGDEGAAAIYNFKHSVRHFIRTDIARAYVDLNRSPDDFSTDGVVKTHTCQMIPIYERPPDTTMIQELLRQHYYPWHALLKQASQDKTILFGVDCHTMAETAPEIATDYGRKRPWVCISNADTTCPARWLEMLAAEFEIYLGPGAVELNSPFKGGYIIKEYSQFLRWFQLELSRETFATDTEKKKIVLAVLTRFTDRVKNHR